MAIAVKTNVSLQLVAAKGQWYIIVPWERADRLHERLNQRGYRSTLYADPSDHGARLELWPGVDPAQALAVATAK